MKTARQTSGFSLVEILIATGLFAGAALAVTGLFAAAHRMEGDSLGEERATLIASGILESMDRGATGGFRIATGTSVGSTVWETLDPSSSTRKTVAYTAEGLPLRSLDPSESEGPCHDREIAEIADIRITHAKAMTGDGSTTELLSENIVALGVAGEPDAGMSTLLRITVTGIPGPLTPGDPPSGNASRITREGRRVVTFVRLPPRVTGGAE